MKRRKTSLLMLAAMGLFVASCSQSGSKSEGTATQEANGSDLQVSEVAIDLAASNILWSGTSVGVYTHTGTVDFTKAEIELKDGKVSGGNFTADLNSMVATDENFNEEKGYTKTKLIGHLKSPDFFDVENHPTASFVITSVEGTTAMGKLTIRGITNDEKVENITVKKDGEKVKITGTMVFDRKKYDVSWDYNMKDMLLKNDIELKIEMIGS